jgi:L-asparaginase
VSGGGSRPRIAFVATGGTMDAVGVDRLDLAWYTETRERLPDGGLLAALPEVHRVADVQPISVPRVPSYALTVEDWVRLARTVAAALRDDDCDGLVLTHGTNTLEETAYFLHLAVPSVKPVVLVGAMRPPSGLGAEGSLNLLRAVQLAADPQARGRGVLVVMNDRIYGARDVTKSSTFRVDAFQAPDTGPLGYVDADGRVDFYHQPGRPQPAPPGLLPAAASTLPRVDVVVSYIGADGAMVRAAVAAGARGIVSAGTGAGRATPLEQDALEASAAAGVVVVQGTRAGSGRVSRSPDMARKGFVVSDNLVPWKAKVLLSLVLTTTTDRAEVQAAFDRY